MELAEHPFSHSGMPGTLGQEQVTHNKLNLLLVTHHIYFLCRLYKMAVALMLAHPYGVTRVMSSYRWSRNIVNGQVVEQLFQRKAVF